MMHARSNRLYPHKARPEDYFWYEYACGIQAALLFPMSYGLFPALWEMPDCGSCSKAGAHTTIEEAGDYAVMKEFYWK